MPFRCYADEQNTEGYEACDYLLEGGSAPPGMCDYEKNEEDAYATVSKVLDTVYLWVGIIAVLFVIIGGINYSISQGDPNKVKKAKETIIYALVGLIVSLLAFSITSFVLGALEGGQDNSVQGDTRQAESANVEAESITVSAPKTELLAGETMQLKTAFEPNNTSNKALIYSSSNPDIVTVGLTGRVTAKKAGTATVTVTTRNGKSTEIELVVSPAVSAITAVDTVRLVDGQTFTLRPKIIPENATNQTLSYKSSKDSVAEVSSDGVIRAKKPGKATITISSTNGVKKKVSVTVAERIKITSIDLSETDITIRVGTTRAITASAKPDKAANKNLTWESSNPSVATVTKAGKIKGIKEGKATITVSAFDGVETVSSKIKVTVSNSAIATTGSTANVKFSGKLRMRKETRDIIDDHRKDFYFNNFSSEIAKRGGYKKYVKKLGGIFAEYADTRHVKVKTAADIQATAEYVWGLMTIWGGDYANGSVHWNWRDDSAWNGGKNDGFYHGQSGRGALLDSTSAHIDDVLSRSTTVRTNCNYMINTYYQKTKLKSLGGAAYKSKHLEMSRAGKITKVNELQVGDIIHFFGSDGGWHHVAMVGEVYKDYVIIYDGGSRYIRSGNYKKKTKRTNSSKLTDDYAGEHNWWAFRPWNIDQNVTLEGMN